MLYVLCGDGGSIGGDGRVGECRAGEGLGATGEMHLSGDGLEAGVREGEETLAGDSILGEGAPCAGTGNSTITTVATKRQAHHERMTTQNLSTTLFIHSYLIALVGT